MSTILIFKGLFSNHFEFCRLSWSFRSLKKLYLIDEGPVVVKTRKKIETDEKNNNEQAKKIPGSQFYKCFTCLEL